ncbi:MAG: ACP S-malonyltransferase [Nitrospinota bacterium]|nr:ACP S-malonyltransferase [Nitrospinota bacterium]
MARKIAFLFPGQGSQFVGMGKSLLADFPAAKTRMEEACDTLGFDIDRLIAEGPEEELKATYNTQPAILLVSVIALEALIERTGVEPAISAGHSLGEFSACHAAGALSFHDAIRLVRKRGELMQSAVPIGVGAMAAVIGLASSEVEAICQKAGGDVAPANFNSPEQTVIAGKADSVEKASALAREKGAKKVAQLPVSAPFHTAMMKPAQEGLAEFMEDMTINDPKFPIIRNVDAGLSTTAAQVRQGLIEQVTGCVRWVDSMARLSAEGVAEGLEIGPGKVLTGLMKRIDRSFKMSIAGETQDIEKYAEESHGQA